MGVAIAFLIILIIFLIWVWQKSSDPNSSASLIWALMTVPYYAYKGMTAGVPSGN
jgi:hypothetical protein